MGDAFDRVGVDIIKFPYSSTGMMYAVVFVDYLTKWPEVFAISDQTSPTIARLLVEKVIAHHGVPSELLSDRETSFLSKLMEDVYKLMSITKTNTTAYHPQTDGLVERFHRTLMDMLAKSVEKNGKDWDRHLPYVLFAYRSSLQQSTGESPFYLLYGRNPRLPTDEVLKTPVDRRNIDLRDYKEEMTHRFSTAWQLAQAEISKAQGWQKKLHDKGAKQPILQVGDRVFVYNPSKKQGKAYKLARSFMGPYRILKLYANGADLRLIAKPAAASIRVSLNWITIAVQIPQTIQTQLVVQIPWVWKKVTANKGEQAMRYHQQAEQGCLEQLRAPGQDDYVIDTNIQHEDAADHRTGTCSSN